MQYSIPYRSFNRASADVDEIVVQFNRKGTNFVELLKNLHAHRINFNIVQSDDFIASKSAELMATVKEQYPEFDFLFSIQPQQDALVEELKRYSLPFYVHTFVRDWDQLYYLVNLGVTDVCIVESMCFDLVRVAEYAHRNGVRVRCIPYICQSSVKNMPDHLKFFIRPEDIIKYEPYVDVCNLIGERANVYYDIYAKSQQWYGKLKEIIIGMEDEVDNRSLTDHFADGRIGCAKRCLKGGACRRCESAFHLAHTLADRNLIVKRRPRVDS